MCGKNSGGSGGGKETARYMGERRPSKRQKKNSRRCCVGERKRGNIHSSWGGKTIRPKKKKGRAKGQTSPSAPKKKEEEILSSPKRGSAPCSRPAGKEGSNDQRQTRRNLVFSNSKKNRQKKGQYAFSKRGNHKKKELTHWEKNTPKKEIDSSSKKSGGARLHQANRVPKNLNQSPGKTLKAVSQTGEEGGAHPHQEKMVEANCKKREKSPTQESKKRGKRKR